MKILKLNDKKSIKHIVDIHMETFTGFFLSFLGRGFITQLYRGFLSDEQSGILVAKTQEDKIIGFLAYSGDIGNLYKSLLKKRLIPMGWYCLLAFIRKPSVLFRLLRAFSYPKQSKRDESYIELSSLGVLPFEKQKGIGSLLVQELKNQIDWNSYKYIRLETDKINNDAVNNFYIKNGFKVIRSYETPEGRSMNEYRYSPL